MKRFLGTIAVLVVIACHPTTTPATNDGGSPAPDAHALSTSDAGGLAGLGSLAGGIGHGLDHGPPPLVIPSGTAAPMPAGATPPDREKELVDLLSGRVGPDALPVVPTDPGETFDEGLRSRLMSPTRFEMGVTFTPVEAKGALTQADLARVVAAARPRVRMCYRNALASNPDLHGELNVEFEILPNGEVKSAIDAPPSSKAAAGNVATSAPLTSCVLGVVKRLYFPAADAGTTSASFTARFDAHMDSAKR